MANPRHEHEWKVWENVKLPDGKVLMPGCITHALGDRRASGAGGRAHPAAGAVVGREHVMASSDCGFASTINRGEPPEIEPEIVWAKFESLAAGARLASRELWKSGRRGSRSSSSETASRTPRVMAR